MVIRSKQPRLIEEPPGQIVVVVLPRVHHVKPHPRPTERGHKQISLYHNTIENMIGKMAEIVEVDKAGRIVLPKRLRAEMGIRERTRLMLLKRDGRLTVIPQDVDEIARRLEKELEGVDVKEIAASVRREINAKMAREHPELPAG